jgi:serine/threonine protein kinase
MTTQGDQLLGLTLNGRYLIEKELGRGGVGVVYLARDKQLLSKPVVIKHLLKESDRNPWFKKKFKQEVEALARIDHPGIVGVLDAGEMADGTPYIVMQFVEGTNLRSQMRVEGMDFARVSNIIRQISQALNAVHDKGICHRDLKPENIMLQSLGEGEELVKLIDFGIAKVKDSQVAANTDRTEIAGTISYMAPEQLMGNPSPSSDIYAMGVLAYEMLIGRCPFNPHSPYQLYEMQRAGVKDKPVDLHPGLPQSAQDVILKALSFDPTDRRQRTKSFCQEFLNQRRFWAQMLHLDRAPL